MDLVGPFQLSEQCNLIGISSAKVEISYFLNNNLLIVLEILIILDVKVDYLLKLLSTLDIMVDLKHQLLIHTEVLTENVITDLKLQLDTFDLEAITLLKEINNNWLKDYIVLVRFQ